MDKLVIEGDSLLIIMVVKGARSENWKIKHIINEIHTILEGFHDVHVAHTYREGNGVVDDLANFGHSVDRMRIWDDVSWTPPSTKMMVGHECKNYGVL